MIQVTMMVPTHTLCPHQMAMTNPQDTTIQQNRKTQQTKQERKSKRKPKATAKMRLGIPRKRMETVNQYMKMETTSHKLRNDIIHIRR